MPSIRNVTTVRFVLIEKQIPNMCSPTLAPFKASVKGLCRQYFRSVFGYFWIGISRPFEVVENNCHSEGQQSISGRKAPPYRKSDMSFDDLDAIRNELISPQLVPSAIPFERLIERHRVGGMEPRSAMFPQRITPFTLKGFPLVRSARNNCQGHDIVLCAVGLVPTIEVGLDYHAQMILRNIYVRRQ